MDFRSVGVLLLGERERAHLVVQLGRAVCIYVCIYVYMYICIYVYMYVYIRQPVRIPLISKCLYVNLF